MNTNLYTLILDDWYKERFNNYTQVKKTSEFRRVYTPSEFLHDHRSLCVSLGRKQGASTAIANFIKKHPELNIRVIFANELLARNFTENYGINLNRHRLFRDIDVDSIDVIFIDDSSYRCMFTTEYEEDLYLSIINRLNTGINTNQWLISFN